MDEEEDIKKIRVDARFDGYRFLLAEIDEMGNNEGKIVFRKLLYLSLLDSVAAIVFPRKGNRIRVVELLRHFSGWADGVRVSLPHLWKLTQLSPEPHFGGLRRFASERLEAWTELGVVLIDKDPSFDEVRGRWPRQQESPVPLEALQHYSLFYGERNRIVHELRTRSKDIPLPMPDQPFYSQVNFPDARPYEAKHTWALMYPVEFYRKLTEETMTNVESYLRENNIDLYPRESHSYYWLDELKH